MKQVELEKEDMKLKQANLNHDVSCLISAFQNAKSSGKFELKNLFLKEISLERLNGLVGDDNTKRVHFADLNAQNSHDLLKAELHHSEEIIASLKQELNSLRNQYESLLNGVIKHYFLLLIVTNSYVTLRHFLLIIKNSKIAETFNPRVT